MWWTAVVVLAVIICGAIDGIDLLTIVCLGVASLLLMRSLTVKEAMEATRPRILLMIASSFALGACLENTGVANWIAVGLVDMSINAGV